MLELPARATAPRKSPADLPGLGFGNWKDRLTWAGLSFIPSGLLVALTTFVTTDIAAVPLLWVVPLALYLGTFIVAFQRKPPISRRFLLGLQPVAVAITIATMDWDAGLAWAISCLAGIAAFLATSLLCHRQLYEQRPGAERLTEYYLWMSIGGSAGGIFSALIAPQIFTNLLEFPLLLGLGMLCRFGGDTSAVLGKRWPLAASTLGALAVVVVGRPVGSDVDGEEGDRDPQRTPAATTGWEPRRASPSERARWPFVPADWPCSAPCERRSSSFSAWHAPLSL